MTENISPSGLVSSYTTPDYFRAVLKTISDRLSVYLWNAFSSTVFVSVQTNRKGFCAAKNCSGVYCDAKILYLHEILSGIV